jgi:hypothetical protein
VPLGSVPFTTFTNSKFCTRTLDAARLEEATHIRLLVAQCPRLRDMVFQKAGLTTLEKFGWNFGREIGTVIGTDIVLDNANYLII